MPRIVLLCVMLMPALAFAQTVSVPVNSFWSFTEDMKISLAATLLRKNATTGNLETIPRQRLALEQMKIVYLPKLLVPETLAATFPGQVMSPMTVWGVRLYHSATGTGFQIPEHPVNVTFNESIIVPAKRKLACVYDMPVMKMGKLTCTVL